MDTPLLDKEKYMSCWDFIPKEFGRTVIVKQSVCWGLFWVILVTLSLIAIDSTTNICNLCRDNLAIPNNSRTQEQEQIIQDNCVDIVQNMWHHNVTECDGGGAVLLSRAFTTLDWARGFAIAYSILSIILIATPWPKSQQAKKHTVFVKVPLIVALLLFSIAFEVNMFENHIHGILIGVASAIGVLCTIPGPPFDLEIFSCCKICKRKPRNLCFMINTSIIWWVLWIFMVSSCLAFVIFWIDSCEDWPTYYPRNRCPSLRSDWYWAEYLFFWTMYALVGYALVNDELEPPSGFSTPPRYQAPRKKRPLTDRTRQFIEDDLFGNDKDDLSRLTQKQLKELRKQPPKTRRASSRPPIVEKDPNQKYFLHQRSSFLTF